MNFDVDQMTRSIYDESMAKPSRLKTELGVLKN
jgi:hypothetical protein